LNGIFPLFDANKGGFMHYAPFAAQNEGGRKRLAVVLTNAR
jgi:hypothetical protein